MLSFPLRSGDTQRKALIIAKYSYKCKHGADGVCRRRSPSDIYRRFSQAFCPVPVGMLSNDSLRYRACTTTSYDCMWYMATPCTRAIAIDCFREWYMVDPPKSPRDFGEIPPISVFSKNRNWWRWRESNPRPQISQ